MTAKKLAKLILEFDRADKDVAEHGWDGGPVEARWEKARAEMVCAAKSIIGDKER